MSIAKALAGNAKVLILDEPSAILTDAEIDVLFAVVRRLTAAGVSVIYISHRLDELFRIAHAGHRDARRPDHRHLPDQGSVRAADRRADGRRHPVRRPARTRPSPTASPRWC